MHAPGSPTRAGDERSQLPLPRWKTMESPRFPPGLALRRELPANRRAQLRVVDVSLLAAVLRLKFAGCRRLAAPHPAPIRTDDRCAVGPDATALVARIAASPRWYRPALARRGRDTCLRYTGCDRPHRRTRTCWLRARSQVLLATELVEAPLRVAQRSVAPASRPRSPFEALDDIRFGVC